MKTKILFISGMLLVIMGHFCASASALEVGGFEIHGWASQGFVQSTEKNPYPVKGAGEGSFRFNEYAINVSKQLTDNLHVGIQLFGQDRGYYGNDKPQIDWAYADYRAFDWLGIRVGKVKMPHGLYNETRDNDMLRTFIFLPQGVYNDLRRDTINSQLGGAIYGTIPAGKMGSFSYVAEVGNILISSPNDSGLAAQVKAQGLASDVSDIDTSTTYAGKLDWQTPVEGLRIVGTASLITTMTANGTVPNNFPVPGYAGTTQPAVAKDWARHVLSTEYTRGDLVLALEYEQIRLKLQPFFGPSSLSTPETYYVSATYRFNDFFELGAYYSAYYYDKNDHHKGNPAYSENNAWQKDLTLTTRFDINKHVVLKFEGHLINGTYLLGEVLPAAQENNAQENWFMFATKLTFGF